MFFRFDVYVLSGIARGRKRFRMFLFSRTAHLGFRLRRKRPSCTRFRRKLSDHFLTDPGIALNETGSAVAAGTTRTGHLGNPAVEAFGDLAALATHTFPKTPSMT